MVDFTVHNQYYLCSVESRGSKTRWDRLPERGGEPLGGQR